MVAFRLAVFLLLGIVASQAPAASRPNIMFILVDDLAWADLGCYGHQWHHTPHIDQLAREGVPFMSAYAPAPICSASRASILTGKTVARVGLEFVVKNEPGQQVIDPPQPLRAPPITSGLPLKETTIAEHLQKAGYATAFFGKWHLNSHHQRYLGWSPTHGPKQHGFETAEEDFGSHPYNRKKLKPLTKEGEFLPDGITERALQYLGRQHERPFFLMVSHFYVHTPIRSPYVWLKKKYEKLAREPRRTQRIEYAAFVETLDHHVGELLSALKSNGLERNTLVVFMSDNGGHPEYTANNLRGSKWNLYEGGIRIPMIARWPGHSQPGGKRYHPVIGYDLFATFAAAAQRPTEETDGMDLLPIINRGGRDFPRPLFWHFPYYHPEGQKFNRAEPDIGINDFITSQTRPHSAIRYGRYKLIYFDEDQRAELYKVRGGNETLELSNQAKEMKQHLLTTLMKHLDSAKARRAQRP